MAANRTEAALDVDCDIPSDKSADANHRQQAEQRIERLVQK